MTQIYLAIVGRLPRIGAHPVSNGSSGGANERRKIDDERQIHLHGHDFALLEQTSNKTLRYEMLNLKLDNPPRET